MRRVGVFAGTFDPVHNGHLAFAKQAIEQGLNKVYFLPEPRPRRKQGVRALEHRQGMIAEAVKQQPQFGLIKLEQSRFSVHETLPVLQQRFPNTKLVLLFGDDVLQHIADWPNIEELVGSVELLIATRHDSELGVQRKLTDLAHTGGLGFRYELITLINPASSSSVRASIRGGDTPTPIPASVEQYIKRHGLYRFRG